MLAAYGVYVCSIYVAYMYTHGRARTHAGGTQVLAILLMIGGAVAWWWTDRKFIENAIGWGGE